MTKHEMLKTLHKAQETYGYANQITVVAEECMELALVLQKYPRFPDHSTASENLRAKVVEEVADVIICLNHLFTMFGISDSELEDQMDSKLQRLKRWLEASNSMYQTVIDRELVTIVDSERL